MLHSATWEGNLNGHALNARLKTLVWACTTCLQQRADSPRG